MGILPDLFLTFARIGLFTFGGGYAMIALIEDACVEKKQWITHDEMMNVTVIAESTPGPIAI
ncbi:MAG: chromate transporter, partial [Solobacterium sp.]|nr:chromate transporter [Solobacterium sp.]